MGLFKNSSNMKRVLYLPCAALLIVLALGAGHNVQAEGKQEPVFAPEETLSVMRSVCDWQLANLPTHALVRNRPRPIDNNGWIRAAFYTGVMATYQATQDEKYLNAAIKQSEDNLWVPAQRLRHGDDHGIGQTYLEIYFLKKEHKMIAPIRATFDEIIDNPYPISFKERMSARAAPPPDRAYWSWCDALFMAPPTMARLSHATGDSKYLDWMNQMWWAMTDYLYDSEEHLYYRDLRYKIYEDGTGPRTANGKKIFWSRGNGWVIGGLVRVLQYMPKDYPDRPKYIQLLKEMSEKVATLQDEDGFWHSSLLDPEEYPDPETSGTGFYCYGLAWGINEGILNKKEYLPVVIKAWDALLRSTNVQGKLGWVQLVGRDPKKVGWDDNMEYASGAMLLAGSEIYKLTAAPADYDRGGTYSGSLQVNNAGRIEYDSTALVSHAFSFDAEGFP